MNSFSSSVYSCTLRAYVYYSYRYIDLPFRQQKWPWCQCVSVTWSEAFLWLFNHPAHQVGSLPLANNALHSPSTTTQHAVLAQMPLTTHPLQ